MHQHLFGGARRVSVALAGLAVMLALAASPVLAGGVAVVVPEAGDGHQVGAGEETTLTFTLLQHGVTPVDFGAARVVVVDTATGDSFSVAAQPAGKPGLFRATVTYPTSGWWAWHVEHDGLLIQSGPNLVPVVGADVPFPVYEPGASRTDAASTLNRTITERTAERDALRATVSDLTARNAELTSQLADADGRPTLAAVVGVGLLAALGGLALGVGLTSGVRSRRRHHVHEISIGAPTTAD